MLPVGCQFKNSSAKRGCALLGNPKVSFASIQSCASMDNSTSGTSARRSNGDLGGGVHLCLMDMTAFGASHGPVLEAGAGRRNALDRRVALEIQACLLLTQVRPKSSEVAACCLVNRGQGLELRPSSNLIGRGWGADHADLEACSRVEMSVMQEGAIHASGRLRCVAEWMHPPVADTVLSAQCSVMKLRVRM
jgi:hypothetical protein